MFWANFIRLCNSVGKTPNGVASELGIPSGSITAWKNGQDQGKRPRDVTLYKIAEYFGVTPEELLQDEPTQKEKTPEPLDPDHNVLIMRGRDGSYIRKQLTDEEVRALAVLVSQMKDAPDDI